MTDGAAERAPRSPDPRARRRRATAGPPGSGHEHPTRVLVVASAPLLRAGLRELLAGEPAITVIDAVALDELLADRIGQTAADALVVAVETHEHDALPSLLPGGRGGAPPVVVLSEDPASLWATAASPGDIRAVLPRDASAVEIVAAIAGAAAGLVVLHPSALESAGAVSPASAGPRQSLTPREIEVLGMLAEGFGNKTVAWRLGISEHTVKFHVASIFAKLGASSRTEAVTTAIRRGVLLL